MIYAEIFAATYKKENFFEILEITKPSHFIFDLIVKLSFLI